MNLRRRRELQGDHSMGAEKPICKILTIKWFKGQVIERLYFEQIETFISSSLVLAYVIIMVNMLLCKVSFLNGKMWYFGSKHVNYIRLIYLIKIDRSSIYLWLF